MKKSLAGVPSLLRRRLRVMVPSVSMVAVPLYGIDGLASDDCLRACPAEAPATHNVTITRMTFLIDPIHICPGVRGFN